MEITWPENCHEMSRKCPEKYIKAHISSFINLRTESKPENVKHISMYPMNTKKTYKNKFFWWKQFDLKISWQFSGQTTSTQNHFFLTFPSTIRWIYANAPNTLKFESNPPDNKKIYAAMYLSEHFMTILRSNHLHPKILSLILPPKTLILTKYV